MKKIYFKGYYGYENLGDDIFTVTAAWICNTLWSNCVPVFIGRKLPVINNTAKKIEINNDFFKRIVELLVCFKVNYIIYFGGSLLSSGGNSFRDIKLYFKKIPYLSNKLGTIGTSIGPFEDYHNFNSTKELLKKFKFISVRDYSSIDLLSQMGLEGKSSFCFDNAILIQEVFPSLKIKNLKKNGKIKIAISLCHYERYKTKISLEEQEREIAVKQLISDIILNHENIEELIFIEFNGNTRTGDTEITTEFEEYFSKKIKTKVVSYSLSTENMLREFNDADFVLGMRLHSGILAYALDIPFMLVEYHPKCTDFLNTINHNVRFDVNNHSKNIEKFNHIMELENIPNLIKPSYFKDIMLNELKDIEKNIQSMG